MEDYYLLSGLLSTYNLIFGSLYFCDIKKWVLIEGGSIKHEQMICYCFVFLLKRKILTDVVQYREIMLCMHVTEKEVEITLNASCK